MKIPNLAAVAMLAFVFGQEMVRADFTDNFSSPAPNPAWTTNASGPAPAFWGDWLSGGGDSDDYMEISVSGGEYNPTTPFEGIVRSVNPVNFGFDCTWAVSASCALPLRWWAMVEAIKPPVISKKAMGVSRVLSDKHCVRKFGNMELKSPIKQPHIRILTLLAGFSFSLSTGTLVSQRAEIARTTRL